MYFRFVEPELRRLDATSADLAICGVFEDVRPARGLAALLDWRLAGRLHATMRDAFATGRMEEAVLVPGRPRLPFERVVLLGLGPRADFDEDAYRRAAKRLLGIVAGLRSRRAVVELPGRSEGLLSPQRAAALLLESADEASLLDGLVLVEPAAAEAAYEQQAREDAQRRRRL